MDTTKRFSNRVDNYKKYRPDYPSDAVDFFYTQLQLEPAHVIADIGSGTGIFTRHLLERSDKVYAIEPNTEMRLCAEQDFGSYVNFNSVNAPAEQTSLPDGSVNCITSAQAFHWFDFEKVKREFLRILRDKKQVVLIYNKRNALNDAFATAYENHVNTCSNDYKDVGYKKVTTEVLERFYRHYSISYFEYAQHFNLEGLLGRAFSSSYSPSPEDPNYEAFHQGLTDIFLKFQKDGKVVFNYRTEMYIGEI